MYKIFLRRYTVINILIVDSDWETFYKTDLEVARLTYEYIYKLSLAHTTAWGFTYGYSNC